MSADPDSPPQAQPPKTYAHAVARWCIRPLIGTSVTPNHLTTLRLVTGMAAALAFGAGTRDWAIIGGTIFLVSAMLDRADGELARLSGRSSPGGHWYDLYSDMAVNVAVFIGIGFGLVGSPLGVWAPAMGVVSGLSIGAIFLIVFQLHDQGSHPSAVFKYPNGFDFDDALFIVVPCAWFGGLLPLLIASAVGAPAFLAFSIFKWHKSRARP